MPLTARCAAEPAGHQNRQPLPASIEIELLQRLAALVGTVDGIIVNDQVPEADHGAITTRVRAALAALGAARRELPITVDSRRRIGLFSQMMLKPNEHETLNALGWQPVRRSGAHCGGGTGVGAARRADRVCTVGRAAAGVHR